MRNHSRYILPGILLAYLMGGWSSGFAQNPQAQPFFVDPTFLVEHWTTEDGLPVNAVTDVMQSSEGYIWIGTFDGLVRFDGVRFKVYKTAEFEGLVSNRIRAIQEAPDGSLFIATASDDLIHYKDEQFTHITSKNGLNGEKAGTFETGAGKLWIGSNEGLTIYEDGQFYPYYPEILKGRINHFHIDRNNTLWYWDSLNRIIGRFDGKNHTIIADQTPELGFFVVKTLNNGSTFITNFRDFYRVKDGKTEDLKKKYNLPESFTVTDLKESKTGNLILYTRLDGAYELKNNQLHHLERYTNTRYAPANASYSEVNPPSGGGEIWSWNTNTIYYNGKPVFSFDNFLGKKELDSEGGFWFCSRSLGLFRLKPNFFKTYSVEEGAPSPNVYPVFQTSDGSIWFGTYGNGPARLKDGEIYSMFNFEPSGHARLSRTIVELTSGELLIGQESGDIYEFDEERRAFYHWDTPQGNINRSKGLITESLFQDSQGRLWAGTNMGLFMKTNPDRNWELISSGVIHPDHVVRNIAEAPDGTLWMATNGGGIVQYKLGKLKKYTTEYGLSSDLVRYIHIDATTTKAEYLLWIGTEDKGLNRLEVNNGQPDFGNITIYNEKSGLYDNVVHVILPDQYDRFWMSGNQGISWVFRSELERYARGNIPMINMVYYTEKDGLRNREANGGVHSPGIVASDSTLWFATQDGLVKIHPSDFPVDDTPVPIVIDQIESNGRRIDQENSSITLKPEQRDFNISYAGLSFTASKKVRFKYRLNGLNENWNDVGSQRTAFFTNIPAGTYQFEVLASNSQGIWNEIPAAKTIVIEPYFHETAIFKMLVFLGMGFAFFLGIRYRTRSLKKKEIELEASIKERTAELESEKRKTEAQARKLQKLDEFKSRFFTNITHEFRTPLTLIIGPLQKLLRTNGDIPMHKIQMEVERALSNSRRLQRLIDQILDLSKLEAGELTLMIQKIDLVEFINNVREMFAPLIEQQNLMLDFSPPSAPVFIYVDADALEKILANLLSNAIKFTPDNGQISLMIEENHKQVLIRIADTGIGIEEDKFTHIFDRFYQTDTSSTRVAEGTGIGLALVKNLVGLHKGKIEVESTLGQGSTFTVSFQKGKEHLKEFEILIKHDLPTNSTFKHLPKEVLAPPVSGAEAETDAENSDHNKPCVLVVEDNLDMRNFVSSVLHENFSVIEAGDGKKALTLIKEKLPDLIISDIMMPNMDGVTLNEELKKDPMLQAIPVIFLTAKAGQENMLEGLKGGVDDYLTKPFDAEILVARAENFIQKRQLLRRHILKEGMGLPLDEKEQDPFVERVSEILRANFPDPDFGVSELAEAINLDRSQIYRKLKKTTGKSPQKFLSDFRVKQAGKLLLERNESISEVAYACGFNNMAYFSSVFKGYYKVTPSEFQARYILNG